MKMMTMKPTRKVFATLALALMSLVMQACTDKNPAEPSGPSVTGTWILVNANGQDAAALGGVWTFGQTESNYTQVALGCSSDFTYRIVGNKIEFTVVDDGCEDNPVGSKTMVNYSISGNRLTMTYDSDVMIFEKEPTANPLLGRWEVQTIDGQVPRNNVVFGFTKTMMLQTANIDGSVCTTGFSYTKSGNRLNITTVADECGVIEIGTTDVVTTTIAGTKLTLVFSDGTTVIANRI